MSDARDELRPEDRERLCRRHLGIGWLGLLIFLALGMVLELMHGLKVGYYLDTRNMVRREMWTLAHTHGTLFSLVHIAFALSIGHLQRPPAKLLGIVSNCLTGAWIALPAGFLLGGLWIHAGDPGMGVLIVPLGALLLLLGVAGMLIALRGDRPAAAGGDASDKRARAARRRRRKR